jgi:hypothetical protein
MAQGNTERDQRMTSSLWKPYKPVPGSVLCPIHQLVENRCAHSQIFSAAYRRHYHKIICNHDNCHALMKKYANSVDKNLKLFLRLDQILVGFPAAVEDGAILCCTEYLLWHTHRYIKNPT